MNDVNINNFKYLKKHQDFMLLISFKELKEYVYQYAG